MPSFAAVSRDRHANKRWLPFGSNLQFAAQTTIAPLVAMELPRAVMGLPIGFIRNGDAFSPAAILSLEPNRNLFVAEDGRWIGSYQPAIFRSFPFRLISTADDKLALCIDEESELMTEGPEGEPFFEGDETGARLKQVMEFLTLVEKAKVPTARACAALDRHGIIKPLTIKGNKDAQEIKGLFQTDEVALNALPVEAFDDLRRSGALPVAYCQLLSMTHLKILGKLSRRLEELRNAPPQAGNQIDVEKVLRTHEGSAPLDMSESDGHDTILSFTIDEGDMDLSGFIPGADTDNDTEQK